MPTEAQSQDMSATKLSKSEEDYMKALFHLIVETGLDKTSTNQLADTLGVAAASVSSMLKKLKAKQLVAYEKYGKLELTPQGRAVAVQLIRKHRLWETFLYRHMNFSWDEVHEVAEQLEHIKSAKLVQQLDRFLGFPRTDPHGSMIPDAEGKYQVLQKNTLAEVPVGSLCRMVSVKDSSVAFLQYVSKIGLELSAELRVTAREDYDQSVQLSFAERRVLVSKKFAENVCVEILAET